MRRKVIRWLASLVLFVALGGVLYYGYKPVEPCAKPVAYSIGAVDSRFNLSNEALLSNLKSAAAIWNKAEGKPVLVYDAKAALKVNLIYDEREANARLGAAIAQQQADGDAVRAALDELQAQFAAAQDAYNQKVNTINARGGATKSEVVVLSQEHDALTVLAASINAKVASYNASVAALNAKVAEFNKLAGHTFREGEYVRDAKGERIDIFEFVGQAQLERVLAHEFGHAIGLGHNDDPKSIMYAKNESGNLKPTASDLAALEALCGA